MHQTSVLIAHIASLYSHSAPWRGNVCREDEGECGLEAQSSVSKRLDYELIVLSRVYSHILQMTAGIGFHCPKMEHLHERNPSLRPPSPRSGAHTTSCANCGKDTICPFHRDRLNDPGTPCCVTSLSEFNAELKAELWQVAENKNVDEDENIDEASLYLCTTPIALHPL